MIRTLPGERVLDCYWSDTPIRCDNKITTPAGSKVTVLKVCLDISFSIKNREVSIGDVELSNGGCIIGSRVLVNMSSERTGEAWHARAFHPREVLKEVALADLKIDDGRGRLSRALFGKWKSEGLSYTSGHSRDSRDELPRSTSSGEIASGDVLEFDYEKPGKGMSHRRVVVIYTEEDRIFARDEKDGEAKSFLRSRMSKIAWKT